jgi:Leucine-rich repeat (LRR) protein
MKYIVVLLIGISLWACKIPRISTNDTEQFILSEKEKTNLQRHKIIDLSIQGQKEEEELLKSLSSKKIKSLRLDFRKNSTLDPSALEYLNFTSPMTLYWSVGLDVKTNELLDKALFERINPNSVCLSYTFKNQHVIDLFIQNLPNYKALTTLWLTAYATFPETDPQEKKLEEVLDILLLKKKLKRWRLTFENLDSIPYQIGRLKNLELLSVTRSGLKTVPSSIGQLAKLTTLILTSNKLKELPESIGDLRKLYELDIGRNQLQNIPSSISKLKKLNRLHVYDNELESIGAYIGELEELEELDLSENQLKILPDEIRKLKKLRTLYLSKNPISKEEQERIKALLPNTTIYF